jgi:hypothetical protein
LAEERPVARDLVLWLITQDGASEVSEMQLARRLGRSVSAVAANLAWLESEGALVVQRRSADGLRRASARRLDVRGCFRLFASVLGRAASAVSRCVRRLRVRARMRAMREKPSEGQLQNCHTPAAVAERYKQGNFFSVGPSADASQRLAQHKQGQIYLTEAALADAVAEVAGEMGVTPDEIWRAYGLGA